MCSFAGCVSIAGLKRKGAMNKRQFDLSVGVFVGAYAAMTGFRLWAGRYLLEGKSGALYTIAEVVKAVTG